MKIWSLHANRNANDIVRKPLYGIFYKNLKFRWYLQKSNDYEYDGIR